MEKRTNKQAKSEKERKVWTPEAKAEPRKKLPERLNKFGEWFFSEAGGKSYIVVHDWKTVMK